MSTQKIRETLLKELDMLMDGKATTEHANAVSSVAAQAIYTTRLEIENKRIEAKLMEDTKQDRWKFIDGQSVSVPTLQM